MEHDDNFKKEIENIKRNPQSAKKSRRKCQELEEAVARLKEEKRLLTDQVDLAEKKCDLIFTENLMMTNDKNNSISALNEKIKELENRNFESERLTEVFQEKFTCLETKIAIMDQELEDLRQRKSELDQVVEDLKLANKIIKELENRNLESERLADVFREKCTCLETEIAKMDQELKDLRQRKTESDHFVEELKLANKTIEELKWEKMESQSRVVIDENYAKMLTKKVGDIATWVSDMGKFGTSEVGLDLDSQGLRLKKENISRNDDDEVVVVDAGTKDNILSNKDVIPDKKRKAPAHTISPSVKPPKKFCSGKGESLPPTPRGNLLFDPFFGYDKDQFQKIRNEEPNLMVPLARYLAANKSSSTDTPPLSVRQTSESLCCAWSPQLEALSKDPRQTDVLMLILLQQLTVLQHVNLARGNKSREGASSKNEALIKDETQKLKKSLAQAEQASARLRSEREKARDSIAEKDKELASARSELARREAAEKARASDLLNDPDVLMTYSYYDSFFDAIRALLVRNMPVDFLLEMVKDNYKSDPVDKRLPLAILDLKDDFGVDLSWWPCQEQLTHPNGWVPREIRSSLPGENFSKQ